MRILFLSTDFVWPPDSGGRVRTLSQLRVLSSLDEVTRIRAFSLCEDEIPAEDRRAALREVAKLELAEPVFHPIHLFRHPRYVPRVAWLRVARGVPYVAAKWDSDTVRRALARELAAADHDVIWLNGLGIARYLGLVRRLAPRARVVLDQHNVESDRFARYAAAQRGPRRLVATAEWRAARRWERDVLRAVDAVGAISADDARACRELAGVDATVVPQVIAPAPRTPDENDEPRFAWIGSLGWAPNADGLDWFCAEVWPLVRSRLPRATCEIVGSGMSADAAAARWNGPGIIARGRVDDLTPVYARATAMIAPILGGAGIRIKLLESFRHGLPAVTTPDGAAGLPLASGSEAFIESTTAGFAARVVELGTSRAARERLRDAGYAFLARHNRLLDAQAAIGALLGLPSAHAAAVEERVVA